MPKTPEVIDLQDIRDALRDERPSSIQTLLAEDTKEQPFQLDLFRLALGAQLERFEEGNSYGGNISGRDAFEAPWTPVPLFQAEEFIASHKRYALEIIFPTVFEEDRSIKIKDIATAQGLDYASHQWAAEQVAKELGREDFNYKQEIAQIKVERNTLPPPPGMEEPLLDPNAPPAAPPSANMPKPGFTQGGIPQVPSRLPEIAPSDEEAPGKRDQLSGPVVAEFKRQQKQSEASTRLLTYTLTVLGETMKMISEKMGTPPQHITIEGARVIVPKSDAPDVIVRNDLTVPPAPAPAPVIVPEVRERTFEVVERDPLGFAKSFRERYLPKEAV